MKRSDNPDVIYGRDFEEEAMKIEELIGEMGEVVIRGKVLSVDTRDIKNEKTIIIFNISDFTDTMTIKMFVRTEQVKEVTGDIKPGAFLKVKGICMMDKFDHELAIGSIAGIKKIPDFTNTRMDTSARKRVELHCHTKMSDMDGVSEAKDIVKRAYNGDIGPLPSRITAWYRVLPMQTMSGMTCGKRKRQAERSRRRESGQAGFLQDHLRCGSLSGG